jgi:hypothetical protein
VFGDLTLGADAAELLAVREDSTGDALVAVSLASPFAVRVLAEAAGFFGSPRPAAGMLAWTWWSARDLPWDACELWVAGYEPGAEIGDPMRVAGGPDESATEPRWGPDGMLYFLSDRTGRRNLHRHDGAAVAPLDADCGAPPWRLGHASYCFLPDDRIALLTRSRGVDEIVVADGSGSVSPVPLPYTAIRPCLVPLGSSIALIGSGPSLPPEVAVVDPATATPAAAPAAGGPVVLFAHPGPADDDAARFLTEHGCTVIHVPPPEDPTSLALALIDSGRATPGEIFVRGTGLGGYLALRAVSSPSGSPFAAATAISPVLDPAAWPAPRFLRPLADRLGPPVSPAGIPTPVLVTDRPDLAAELRLYRRDR